MQYCVDHPEEISKLAKVKAQVSEVKGVMMENIEKVYLCSLWISSRKYTVRNCGQSLKSVSDPSILFEMQVLDRGEKIELLVDKTENLRSQVLTHPVILFCTRYCTSIMFLLELLLYMLPRQYSCFPYPGPKISVNSKSLETRKVTSDAIKLDMDFIISLYVNSLVH